MPDSILPIPGIKLPSSTIPISPSLKIDRQPAISPGIQARIDTLKQHGLTDTNPLQGTKIYTVEHGRLASSVYNQPIPPRPVPKDRGDGEATIITDAHRHAMAQIPDHAIPAKPPAPLTQQMWKSLKSYFTI